MRDLWVVNTSIQPSFFSMINESWWIAEKNREHVAFLDKMRSKAPSASFPYLALLPENKYRVPLDATGHAHNGLVVDGKLIAPSGKLITLDTFVDQLVEGSTGSQFLSGPLNCIVNFSREELYPATMATLEKKYNVTRVTVD